MQPYGHLAPQVGSDVLIAEQVHHQNQIHNNAIGVFLASRKYARSLTKTNIRVPAHQKPADMPYEATDKCLQITLSRTIKSSEITNRTKERLIKMQDRLQHQLEQNNELIASMKKDKTWIRIKMSSSHKQDKHDKHNKDNKHKHDRHHKHFGSHRSESRRDHRHHRHGPHSQHTPHARHAKHSHHTHHHHGTGRHYYRPRHGTAPQTVQVHKRPARHSNAQNAQNAQNSNDILNNSLNSSASFSNVNNVDRAQSDPTRPVGKKDAEKEEKCAKDEKEIKHCNLNSSLERQVVPTKDDLNGLNGLNNVLSKSDVKDVKDASETGFFIDGRRIHRHKSSINPTASSALSESQMMNNEYISDLKKKLDKLDAK